MTESLSDHPSVEGEISLESVLQRLNSRVLMPKTAPGLEKTHQALARLDLQFPSDLQRSILVAGTNGKGSVCRLLEHFLLSYGENTFLFTSPHLVSVRERIRVNGRSVSPPKFIEAFLTVDRLTHDLDLSHFETLTVMAAWLAFDSHQQPSRTTPKWFIWEVGLGGTWDATNALPHGTSILTQIGLDHQDLLGTSIEEIAQNKLGILCPQNLVITHPIWEASLFALLNQKRNELDLQVISAANPEISSIKAGFPLPLTTITMDQTQCILPESGQRFGENLMIAIQALKCLQIPLQPGLNNLNQYYWPGRGDIVYPSTFRSPLMLSGDHNPQGIESLKELLACSLYEKIYLLVGIGQNKPADKILELLSQIPRSKILLTQSPFRGCNQYHLAQWITKGLKYIQNPQEGLRQLADKAGPKDLIVVTGSLYLVGEVYQEAINKGWLNKKQQAFFM